MKKSNLEKLKDKTNKKESSTKDEIAKLKEVINEILDLLKTRTF